MFKKSFLIAFVVTGFSQASQQQKPDVELTTPRNQVQDPKPSVVKDVFKAIVAQRDRDGELRQHDERRKENQRRERSTYRDRKA